MTGAPIPEGADAVVRVEDTSQTGAIVTIKVGVPSGTSVRAAGGDVEAGAEVIDKGIRLTPAHIGVLANIGVAEVAVHRRPRVALASTGDELVPVDGPALGPGQIRDSNRPMLAAMLTRTRSPGGRPRADPRRCRCAPRRDRPRHRTADAIVTSGGVSMGEYDLVKQVLGELGNIEFWQVAMQPAKPFAFGKVGGQATVRSAGQPGLLDGRLRTVRPPRSLEDDGCSDASSVRGCRAAPGSSLPPTPEKTVFVRVRTTTEGEVRWSEPSGGQSSNVLSAVGAGDAFAVVPRGNRRRRGRGAVMLEMFRWPEERTFDER